MTEPGDGSVIADKGWPARKLYLSPEAIALMENHCKGTPLTMSAYVDMLIKRDAENPYLPADYKERIAPAETPAQRSRPGEYLGEPKRGTAADVPARERVTTAANKKDFDLDV